VARHLARPLVLRTMLLGSVLMLAATTPIAAQDGALADAVGYVHDKVVSCWNVPPAAARLDATVRVKFRLERDGRLADDPVVLNPRPDEPAFALLAESARRAVIRCAPYDGLKRHAPLYQGWREIIVNFRSPFGR
jgi:hypothetical protein